MKIYHKFTNRKNYGTRLETSMSLGGKYADILHTHTYLYILHIFVYGVTWVGHDWSDLAAAAAYMIIYIYIYKWTAIIFHGYDE